MLLPNVNWEQLTIDDKKISEILGFWVLKYDDSEIKEIVLKIVEKGMKDLFFVKKLLIYPTKHTGEYLNILKSRKDLES